MNRWQSASTICRNVRSSTRPPIDRTCPCAAAICSRRLSTTQKKRSEDPDLPGKNLSGKFSRRAAGVNRVGNLAQRRGGTSSPRGSSSSPNVIRATDLKKLPSRGRQSFNRRPAAAVRTRARDQDDEEGEGYEEKEEDDNDHDHGEPRNMRRRGRGKREGRFAPRSASMITKDEDREGEVDEEEGGEEYYHDDDDDDDDDDNDRRALLKRSDPSPDKSSSDDVSDSKEDGDGYVEVPAEKLDIVDPEVQWWMEKMYPTPPDPTPFTPTEFTIESLRDDWPAMPVGKQSTLEAVEEKLSYLAQRRPHQYIPADEMGKRLFRGEMVEFTSEREKVETVEFAEEYAAKRARELSRRKKGKEEIVVEPESMELGSFPEEEKTELLGKAVRGHYYKIPEEEEEKKAGAGGLFQEVMNTLASNGSYRGVDSDQFMKKLEAMVAAQQKRAAAGAQRARR